jgi:hypothetical protein
LLSQAGDYAAFKFHQPLPRRHPPTRVQAALAENLPVISVDTKKKAAFVTLWLEHFHDA